MDDNIRDILDKISSDKESGTELPETFEFELGEESLLFEYGDKKQQSEEKTEDALVSSEEKENKLSDEKDDDRVIASDQPVETPPGIFKAYVPRFTEVSETYRMIDDPRPRKDGKLIRAEVAATVDNKNEASRESVNSVNTVDPTAEIEETVNDAVIVNMSVPTEDEDADTLNVFKFSEEDKPAETERVRTVDDERREIKRLISKEEPAVEQEQEVAPPQETEQVEHQKPKSFDLPDPDSGLKVFDYEEESKSCGISPEGVSEYVPEKGKGIGREFERPIQRDGIKDRFLDLIMATRIRLGAICFFGLLLLCFELTVHYELFEYKKLALFTFTGTVALVDLLLSISVFLLALPEAIASLNALLRGKLVSELSVILGFAVMMIYTASIMLIKVYNYPLYGFLFAILSLFAVIGTLSRAKADFSAFKLISGNGEKHILEKKLTRELPEENYALDGLVDEYSSRTARIFRAAFITDFYKRTSKISEKSSHNGIIMGITLALSLIVATICYFLVDVPTIVPSSFALVCLLGLPAFGLLSHKLPFKYAEDNANAEESAVIGEDSCFEFSDVDVICFEDSEIFGIDDVNLKRFMLYGDRDNMENVMRKMCSLFSVVGGPLKSIFVNALDNRVRHNPAINTVIEADGLSGEVSGKLIYAGSEEYMQRHGIAIPEGASTSERKNDTTRIMYAAEENEVYAKFYIRYSFSEEFTMLLPELKEQGITPLIYTSDPNLSAELIKRLTAGADCVRVMKRLIPGTTDERLHNRVSSGMVTVGDKINAINLVLLSKRYKHFSERLTVSEITAMGIGTAAAALLSFMGITDLPMAFFGLWHAFWGLALYFSAKAAFLKGKTHSEVKEENE